MGLVAVSGPSLADLQFTEVPHEYRHRPTDRVIPGVTNTMRDAGLGFQGFAPQSALDRGNYTHEASVLIDENALDWSQVPEEWEGYCRAYERAVRERDFTPTNAEWRFWHPQFFYAGTLDRVGFKKGRRGGVELKTGSHRHVATQSGAYDRGWAFWNPTKLLEWWECWVLHGDGTYTPIELDVAEGFMDFAAVLRVSARKREP